MSRASRRRISKNEELLAAALKERRELLRRSVQVWRGHARYHAAAVAAIVLFGQPRIDESSGTSFGAGFAALWDFRKSN
jgi:hypothetical protein